MIIKREDGFSLVELMITMVVFVLFMIAATNVFTGLLTQFKQQSKQAETNIEGIVGLEIMRQDIEGAGYGLPWNVEIDGDEDFNDWEQLTNYNETNSNPHSLNDAPSGAPKAIVSYNPTSGPDYLVIRSVTVARNAASDKWTTLSSSSPYVKTWTTAGELTPVSENLQNTDRVIVISPTGSAGIERQLIVNGSAFSTTFSGVTSLPWRPTPSAVEETRVVYGVDPGSNLRMPFNRADYFISSVDELSNNIVPKRCAPNTGVLVKAMVNQSNGNFTYLPLLDCVADIQVIYGLDTINGGSINNYNADLTVPLLTAQDIREQVKQVRVYILAHEGQKDTTFTYPSSSVILAEDISPSGTLGNTFDLATAIGDPDYKYYRWKLYTIVVTPNNLE